MLIIKIIFHLVLLLALINGNEKFINDLIKKVNINERDE